MDDRATSEFNMAVSYLNRLNSLFYVCDEAAISLNMYTWFHGLRVLHRELYSETVKEEQDKLREYVKQIDPLMTIWQRRTAKGDQSVQTELYELMNEYELAIRAVLKKAGLQNKMMSDPRMAL